MFLLDDAYLVIGALGVLPLPANAESILTSLNTAASNSTVLSDRIEADLAELLNLDVVLATEMGTGDYAISKIDVISFEVKERIKGILFRYQMLATRLATALDILSLVDLKWIDRLLSSLDVTNAGIETITLRKY
jgi:hypothetical protein